MYSIEKILSELGSRSLAYLIVSLLFEEKPVVIIHRKENDICEQLIAFINDLKEDFKRDKFLEGLKFPKSIDCISYRDYLNNWREYIGHLLIFIEDDKNIISRVIDNFEKLIPKLIKPGIFFPEEKFKKVILRILTKVFNIFDQYGDDLSSSEIQRMLKIGAVFKEEPEIIMDLCTQLVRLSE